MTTTTKWIIGGIVAVAVAGGVTAALMLTGGDGSDDESPQPGPTDLPSGIVEEDIDPIVAGEEAGFAVGVYAAECGFENVVTPEGSLEAEGEFCTVDVNLVNTSDEPRGLDISCQFLIDAEGERHTPSLEASTLDPDYFDVFGGEMEPGFVYDAVQIIYDVPKGTTPASVEIHGDCDGPGIIADVPPEASASA